MKATSFIVPTVLIAAAGLLVGCQSVLLSDLPVSSEGSTMRFATGKIPELRTATAEEAGSSFRFHPLANPGRRGESPSTYSEGIFEDSGATLRFR